MKRALIGIDIGWSDSRATCGIAFRDASLSLEKPTRYDHVVAGKMRLRELEATLARWVKDHADEARTAVVVIDGPLGDSALAFRDRRVDSEFGTNDFHLRAQPVLVSHPSSKEYVAATYQAVDALGPTSRQVWLGGEPPTDRLVVAETHPTVGLCLLVPKQPVEGLPTRRRARILAADGRSIRAKSDWYWALGARNVVAEILGTRAAAGERDHERVAALYCLAVAHALASHTKAVAVGDADGIYALPARIADSWATAVNQIGLTHGQVWATGATADESVAVKSDSVDVQMLSDDLEGDGEARGDWFDLYLHDNGSVWDKHNAAWLSGTNQPVELVTDRGLSVALTPADRAGQWVSKPSTRNVARHHGFEGEHLSGRSPVVVRARLAVGP